MTTLALLVGLAAYLPTGPPPLAVRLTTAMRSRNAAPRATVTPTPPVNEGERVVGQVATSTPTDAFGGKLYDKKELPPIWGGLKVGTRKLVVVTGASSGLGLRAAKALADKKNYFVICAVRDPDKMDKAAKEVGISRNDYLAMKLELGSLQIVRDFVDNLRTFTPARPAINHLICNAAVYRPADPKPAWTDDGYEMSLGVNHLGHFLLLMLLMPELKRARGARVCIVGSVTGNSNTIAGSFVKPVAEIGELEGLKAGGGRVSAMAASVDEKFDGAKAYKDAKALNMMTVLEMHRRYHEETGIVFNSMYPGCIAETNLFREKRQWFKDLFPVFMKTVGAYVSENEAGERLAQVIDDPRCTQSGVYWSWNGNAKQFGLATNRVEEEDGIKKFRTGAGGAGGGSAAIFENEFSGMISDARRGKLAYEYSMEAVRDFL